MESSALVSHPNSRAGMPCPLRPDPLASGQRSASLWPFVTNLPPDTRVSGVTPGWAESAQSLPLRALLARGMTCDSQKGSCPNPQTVMDLCCGYACGLPPLLCPSAAVLLGTSCSLLLQERGHCRDATAAAAPEEGALGGVEQG